MSNHHHGAPENKKGRDASDDTPTQDKNDGADCLLEPGISYGLIRHDSWCPGARGDADRCRCNPDFRVVGAEEYFKTVAANRKKHGQTGGTR